MPIRWGFAVAVLLSFAACKKQPAPLPVERPADLKVRSYQYFGLSGTERSVTIDAKGGSLDDEGLVTPFEVTDAERDALWKVLRDAHVERMPPPVQAPPDVDDAGGAGIDISFGTRSLHVGAASSLVDPIDALAKKAVPPSLPEARPADLAVSVHSGGGEDGSWWTVEVKGHDGSATDSGGTKLDFTVSDADLDAMWATIRAYDPYRIKTAHAEHNPDEIARSVKIEFGTTQFVFGGSNKVDIASVALVQSIDAAIMKLAAGKLPPGAEEKTIDPEILKAIKGEP